jgi:CheY-like chemotaxis protein
VNTFLLIADDDDIRELMTHVVRHLGIPFRCAKDGFEALAHIRQQRPALVLMDLCMPSMTGWDMLDQVRNDSTNQTGPIIVLTTLPVSDRLAASLQLPIEHIVQKHQSLVELQALIRSLLKDNIDLDVAEA